MAQTPTDAPVRYEVDRPGPTPPAVMTGIWRQIWVAHGRPGTLEDFIEKALRDSR